MARKNNNNKKNYPQQHQQQQQFLNQNPKHSSSSSSSNSSSTSIITRWMKTFGSSAATLLGSGRRRMWILTLGGVSAYGLSTLCFLKWRRNKLQQQQQQQFGGTVNSIQLLPKEGEDVSEKFNHLSEKYDSKIRWDEITMGLLLLRRFLVSHAKGNVLEVSAGTGRNTTYYKSNKCSSLTITDKSPQMLEIAKKKAINKGIVNTFNNNTTGSNEMKFTADIMDAQNLNFADKSFDTVVDTFGLCSCSDPKRVLTEMQRVCKSDGKILLLEHGKSKYNWLNKIINQGAAKHAMKWGCWYNRDISKIVSESGLKVEKMRRWHFGTTYYIIASPLSSQPSSSTTTS